VSVRAGWLAAAILAGFAAASDAQPREPIGWFVADVRAASAGLPVGEGWTPGVAEGTQVPARTLGFEFGAHVQFVRFRVGALGIGATWLTARGTASPPEPAEGTVIPPDAIDPTVTTRLTSLSPQLSLNFGHALGWSYISAGLGRTRVQGEAEGAPGSTSRYAPVDSDWVTTLNFGGGARWFVNDRVGVGFDLRWRRLRPVAATATRPGAAGESTLSIAAGLSVK
jgi:hypothetical protein